MNTRTRYARSRAIASATISGCRMLNEDGGRAFPLTGDDPHDAILLNLQCDKSPIVQVSIEMKSIPPAWVPHQVQKNGTDS